MRKTLSLLGLLFVGLMLLANPSTGILAASDPEPVVVAEKPATAIGGDPPPSDDEAATAAEIVAVDTLQLPADRKSTSINRSAVPRYEDAVISAQGTDIDVISGATVTWDNYTASVQSALDEVAR